MQVYSAREATNCSNSLCALDGRKETKRTSNPVPPYLFRRRKLAKLYAIKAKRNRNLSGSAPKSVASTLPLEPNPSPLVGLACAYGTAQWPS